MESGGLPFLYVLKSFILVFSITMLLQGISEIIKQALILSGIFPTSTTSVEVLLDKRDA
jgi:TRAP-type mannitol/chloroaromatic compound transport system permease small subunit